MTYASYVDLWVHDDHTPGHQKNIARKHVDALCIYAQLHNDGNGLCICVVQPMKLRFIQANTSLDQQIKFIEHATTWSDMIPYMLIGEEEEKGMNRDFGKTLPWI